MNVKMSANNILTFTIRIPLAGSGKYLYWWTLFLFLYSTKYIPINYGLRWSSGQSSPLCRGQRPQTMIIRGSISVTLSRGLVSVGFSSSVILSNTAASPSFCFGSGEEKLLFWLPVVGHYFSENPEEKEVSERVRLNQEFDFQKSYNQRKNL